MATPKTVPPSAPSPGEGGSAQVSVAAPEGTLAGVAAELGLPLQSESLGGDPSDASPEAEPDPFSGRQIARSPDAQPMKPDFGKTFHSFPTLEAIEAADG